jgi:hypothetical protein
MKRDLCSKFHATHDKKNDTMKDQQEVRRSKINFKIRVPITKRAETVETKQELPKTARANGRTSSPNEENFHPRTNSLLSRECVKAHEERNIRNQTNTIPVET